MNFLSELFAFLAELFKPQVKKEIEERPSVSATGQKKKYLPDELALNGPNVNPKGKYKTKSGMPIGAVVHHTAGWNYVGKAKSTLENTKYGFLCIDYDGTCYQPRNLPFTKFAYHAGKSAWVINGKKTTGISNRLVGIEICGGGLLEKHGKEYKTWFGKTVPASKRRTVKAEDNRMAGTYEKFSQAQEDTLINILVWMCKNDPEFQPDLILGHDEVAGPKGIGYHRKNDPGGSLSMTMSQLREKVKARL